MARDGDGALSEYQRYEFVALDRPLSPRQMADKTQRLYLDAIGDLAKFCWSPGSSAKNRSAPGLIG